MLPPLLFLTLIPFFPYYPGDPCQETASMRFKITA
jgi:hypothetical protein